MAYKILFGDNSAEIRASMGRAFRARQMDVDLASTAQETIDKAKANNYSAVITDLEYTENGREGFEILRQIKDIPSLKILYTGRVGFEVEAEGLGIGADFVVLKKDHSRLMEILKDNMGATK